MIVEDIGLCKEGLQHCWVPLPKDEGMPSHSCPTCGMLVYWSDILLSWVKPALSGRKAIPGNKRKKHSNES